MYFARRTATNAWNNTTIEAPIATYKPAFLPSSTHVFATVILTNPGGITPKRAAKYVIRKSFVSSKVLFYLKLDIGNRFSLFKVLFFIECLDSCNLFWRICVFIDVVIGM